MPCCCCLKLLACRLSVAHYATGLVLPNSLSFFGRAGVEARAAQSRTRTQPARWLIQPFPSLPFSREARARLLASGALAPALAALLADQLVNFAEPVCLALGGLVASLARFPLRRIGGREGGRRERGMEERGERARWRKYGQRHIAPIVTGRSTTQWPPLSHISVATRRRTPFSTVVLSGVLPLPHRPPCSDDESRAVLAGAGLAEPLVRVLYVLPSPAKMGLAEACVHALCNLSADRKARARLRAAGFGVAFAQSAARGVGVGEERRRREGWGGGRGVTGVVAPYWDQPSPLALPLRTLTSTCFFALLFSR